MDVKNQKRIIIILGVLLLVLAGGLIYSILSMNSKIASLNYVIFYLGEQHKKDKAEWTATETALETSVEQTTKKYDNLTKKYQDTLSQLSSVDDKVSMMSTRLMCPSTIPFVDYSNDSTVAAALKEFTSDYKATDDHYEAVQKNAKISYHNVKSSRTQSFFIVFFEDKTNGRVNGVFDVLGQYWVNLNNQ
jgi:hypothetical protein